MAGVSIYFPRPGVTVQALTEAALRDLGSMDVEGIDSAADAALTLSGLKMEFATPGDVLGEAGSLIGSPANDTSYSEAVLEDPNTRPHLRNPHTSGAVDGQSAAAPSKLKRKRERKAKGHGVNSKRRALYQKAILLSSSLQPETLAHSAPAYIGSDSLGSSQVMDSSGNRPTLGPLPAAVPQDAHPKLHALLRGSYTLVPSDGRPTLFPDVEGRIIGWRVSGVGGEAGEERQEQRQNSLSAAVEKMASKVQSTKSTGVPRGNHRWTHWGYSFGGGETGPTNKYQTGQERKAWTEFLSEPAYIETTKILADSWLTWAPEIFQDYRECHDAILSRDPNLDRVCSANSGVELPFATITANLGPQTVCEDHRDIKNRADGGLCSIETLGMYDWRRGGHIVLHELGLVVEMKPGDILFFPSAVITHSTIPIFDGETRYSLVWYSAGGLFRWKNAGFQTHTDWKRSAPTEFKKHEREGASRWSAGWKRFSTLPQLMAKVSKSMALGMPGASD